MDRSEAGAKKQTNKNFFPHPRLVVKHSEQVHGIVVILSSQWAAGREREEKMKREIIFIYSLDH